MTQPRLYTTDFDFRDVLQNKLGFQIKEMADDGNSLYSALAFLVMDDENDWEFVRHLVAEEVDRNRQYYEHRFLVTLSPDKIMRIRGPGEEGGMLEMHAASNFFRIAIVFLEPLVSGNTAFQMYEGDAIYISLHKGHKFNALIPLELSQFLSQKE